MRYPPVAALLAPFVFAFAGCGAPAPCVPQVTVAATCASGPCPPGPPADGPGSMSEPHADVVVSHTSRGVLGAHSFTTYEPTAPAPRSAPVVLFLHGFFDAEPTGIDAMLRHVARAGFIVIYPTYGVPWGPADWEENAVEAFDTAMNQLATSGSVKPDRAHTAIIGHSIGGLLAMRLAARAGAGKDPRIKPPAAVVLLDSAGSATPAYPFLPIDDLSTVDASTRLLVVMAEESYSARKGVAGSCSATEKSEPMDCNAFGVARRAFAGTPQIPADHKAAVVVPADARGSTMLRSDHNAIIEHCGGGARPIGAIDTWGYWKLAVGAVSQATRGTWGDYAFGDTPRARAMGTWSDGHAFREIFPIGPCLLGDACP